MDTSLIRGFAVEKVTDDIILKVIYTGSHYERFKRSDTHIRSCWGNEDEGYAEARRLADSLNERER